LFGETASRILVTLNEKDLRDFLKLAKKEKCPAVVIGRVIKKSFVINDLINIEVRRLQEVWAQGLQKAVGV
jgi:phosphoribosylformylglycinamidine (FGAM) synthase-like enzyme